MITNLNPTLAVALWPESRTSMHRGLLLAAAGSMLLWASAKIQVPFWPVPMTMQTFVVLALGAALGWRLGALAVLFYLAEGAAGLPVFAGTPERGIGLTYMAGPTGGFLVGFVAAALIVGWLAERGWDRSIPRLFVAMAIGHAAIFAFGVAWLTTLIGFDKAWAGGVAPFYWATLFKTALGALAVPAAWQLVRRRSAR